MTGAKYEILKFKSDFEEAEMTHKVLDRYTRLTLYTGSRRDRKPLPARSGSVWWRRCDALRWQIDLTGALWQMTAFGSRGARRLHTPGITTLEVRIGAPTSKFFARGNVAGDPAQRLIDVYAAYARGEEV